jgi:hypothetical protein
VLVKNRWVGPREQVLNIPITCRWYVSDKPSSRPSIECWLCPPLLHWLARERNWVQTYGSVSRHVMDCVMSPFSQEQCPPQLCGRLHKRLLCVDHVRYIWSRTICGSSVGYVWRVGQVFPCRVYIDSNRRDSQVWVPLVCGSHHVDNLTDLISLPVSNVCCLIHSNVCNSCLSRVGCTLLQNDLNRAKIWK